MAHTTNPSPASNNGGIPRLVATQYLNDTPQATPPQWGKILTFLVMLFILWALVNLFFCFVLFNPTRAAEPSPEPPATLQIGDYEMLWTDGSSWTAKLGPDGLYYGDWHGQDWTGHWKFFAVSGRLYIDEEYNPPGGLKQHIKWSVTIKDWKKGVGTGSYDRPHSGKFKIARIKSKRIE
jgi:hypothetical protein